MKGKKTLAVGLAAGMVLTMSVQVFGQTVVQMIQAKINPEYHITFDGEEKELTEDYNILIYKDRTYVPARFVAEELGATVNWHEDTKEIEIIRPKTPSTTGGGVTKPEDTTGYDYKSFPIVKESEDYKLEAFMYNKDKDTGNQRVWFRLTNKTDRRLQLDQYATIVEENGKKYEMEAKRAADFDKRWYSDIQKDDMVEGYILLPDGVREPEKLHIEVKLNWNNPVSGGNSSETVSFDIAL